ncbi:phosphoribosyl-AMP cyclohydrolase [Vibrio sp. WXL210]|uniref:phosphoribosyl-AMP cyclohydrolase n=1 Tax=Vibrio sp. WXL210 TaxID=3450709 RepID=UPI003EC7B9BC
MKLQTLLTTAMIVPMSSSVFASVVNQAVNEAEVLEAQSAWCHALVEISHTYREQGHSAAKELATQVIDSAYAYQMGAVLFKPTLTVNPQTFRTTNEGALSYFVGGNDAYPMDTGFALKNWAACEIENAGVFITGNSASTMGKVHFTDKDGEVTSVDKTWKFVKDDQGKLRIALHHSSLEFHAN